MFVGTTTTPSPRYCWPLPTIYAKTLRLQLSLPRCICFSMHLATLFTSSHSRCSLLPANDTQATCLLCVLPLLLSLVVVVQMLLAHLLAINGRCPSRLAFYTDCHYSLSVTRSMTTKKATIAMPPANIHLIASTIHCLPSCLPIYRPVCQCRVPLVRHAPLILLWLVL